jgi:predicted metalloendopeptidase
MVSGSPKERIYRIGNDEKPEFPRFSTEYIDHSIDPFDNFFLYSNGKWIENHPIPPEKSFWGSSGELMEWNRYILGKILEQSALSDDTDPIRKQVGKFYLSAMDTDTIESLGFRPIKPFMERIESMGTREEIVNLAADLHRQGIPMFFSIDSSPDDKNSEYYAFRLSQGGISLPNRDYYLEPPFEKIRQQYRDHIRNMFLIYGIQETEAAKYSEVVYKIEEMMAKASRSPVDLRDPERNYNPVHLNRISEISQKIDFTLYFKRISLPDVSYIIVGQPEFFKGLDSLIEGIPIDEWKIYLKWKVLHFAASYLHSDVEKENFDFYYRKLFGQPEPEKRWKQAVSIVDMNIGEALGKLYVDQEFGEESRKRIAVMIDDLKEVFAEKLKQLDWMSALTKEKALEKFSRFRAKIGFPSKFIDYSSVEILENDYFGNVVRSNAFEFNREISRIGSPVDRELWYMTPPTVNAYFSPTENEIVFPAGILQPPFFDPELDDAVNYGSLGGTIAHEITHGFDDEGRKYDSKGNLKEWWSEDDEKAFLSRAQEVIDLYGSQEVLPEVKVNGELTLGENIADLGGVSIAYEALERHLKKNPELRKNIEGFTPEQRFFLGWAQSWRSNIRDEALKWQVSNDPHSPDNLRGDLPARVHFRFQEHFSSLSKKKNTGLKSIMIW